MLHQDRFFTPWHFFKFNFIDISCSLAEGSILKSLYFFIKNFPYFKINEFIKL